MVDDNDFETLKQIALTIARRSEEHEERMDALKDEINELKRRNEEHHGEIVELINQNQVILNYLFSQQRGNGAGE